MVTLIDATRVGNDHRFIGDDFVSVGQAILYTVKIYAHLALCSRLFARIVVLFVICLFANSPHHLIPDELSILLLFDENFHLLHRSAEDHFGGGDALRRLFLCQLIHSQG